MIALGTVWIGNYRVWVTQSSPVLELDPDDANKQIEKPYYDVLLVQEESKTEHFYINLLKDDKFRWLFNLDERNNPTELADEAQYNAYLDRKSMGQPMWKLSGLSLHRLFCSLLFLNHECTKAYG
jgi:hypothetical protein